MTPDNLDRGDRARAELADLIDLQMSPLGLAAIAALAPKRGQTILDVGCGAGQTILQLMDRLGPDGHVIGVDFGPRVLAVARARSARLRGVTLLQQDAATLSLPDACLDGIYSRFGMMFFTDTIRAFTNMRRMLRTGGSLAFVCWRAVRENALDFVPLEAAGLDIAVDEAPFSLARSAFVEEALHAAGFDRILIEPFDAQVSSGGIDDMLKVVMQVGALGKILRERPELLPGTTPRVRAALSMHEHDGQVSLNAATWIVSAIAA
ncbi:MAG: class I SAM-dependent methyltransferase [Sphingobium sp.]|nr:class I SAM-dependent methyltransferase [Sphingobium sp.]